MRTAIVGLGSILMGDDGVGPYCLKVLEGGCTFPESAEMGIGLSPAVQEAAPVVVAKVIEILHGWGIEPQEGENASADIWWSRPHE